MIALKVLGTFCLATFCLVSAATLTENENDFELTKDTIEKLSETIPEIEAKFLSEEEEDFIDAEPAPKGKRKF